MNIITLEIPWPSTAVVIFKCLKCLKWDISLICSSWVPWLPEFGVFSVLPEICLQTPNPKEGQFQVLPMQKSKSSTHQAVIASTTQSECIPLGSEGAAQTINNIFPPWWCAAILFLTRGWMSVVVNAQSCDLLWFEGLCKNVRYQYTPACPIIHSARSDSSVLRTNARLPAFHKSSQN